MNRILSRALALVHTVIEYASIDGGRIIVGGNLKMNISA